MVFKNTGTKAPPPHPGEVLKDLFMEDYGLTESDLARRIGVDRQSINALVRGRKGITAAMALRLSRLFGNTERFWMNLQDEFDIWNARQNLSLSTRQIKPLVAA